MAVKLRLKRVGRKHQPSFRLAAMESRNPRDGRVLEELGFYNPASNDPAGQLKLNVERIRYWLSVGAQPTETVRHLLRRGGIAVE